LIQYSHYFFCLIVETVRPGFFLLIIGDNSLLLLGFLHPLNFVLIVNFIPLPPPPTPDESFVLLLSDPDDNRRHLTLIF
jgi:hypothetical protein